MNEIEEIVMDRNPAIFRIKKKSDIQVFLDSPAKAKLLFLYMPGCGPCRHTAPEIARLVSRSSKDLLIACISSDNLEWLLESDSVQFSSGSPPMGFPHMEMYANNRPVGELTKRSAPQMLLELVSKFPFLKGKIELLPVSKEGGTLFRSGGSQSNDQKVSKPLRFNTSAEVAERLQELKSEYADYKTKRLAGSSSLAIQHTLFAHKAHIVSDLF